jgi:sugar (pentulose or hexulose) kinase
MADEIGYALQPVLTTGGGTRSAVWNQMLADVVDAPLKLCRESETTALGAAMLGTVAAGIHPDLIAAAQAMCGTGDEYLPDRTAVDDYALLRSIHGELYPALETTYRRLSELNR